jgi:sugar/nucleoside kinase (ribokinase family)
VSPDLVLLGNLLVDDVVFPDGRTRMCEPGGATLYGALGAALWGTRVGVVSVLGSEYPIATMDALEQRGVDLAGVERLERPGLRTWLLYEGVRRRVVHRLDGPTQTEVSPLSRHIPAGWEGARAFHLAPMPAEVQAELLGTLSRRQGALVSLDPYVLLTEETLEPSRGLLGGIDVLFVSEDEMEVMPRDDARTALPRLASDRLATIVYKRGERGGLVLDTRGRRFVEWNAKATRVVDPTGAGDAFAAGFLAGTLRGEPLEACLARGVVTASFAIEDWGSAGLMAATPERAQQRLADWFSL